MQTVWTLIVVVGVVLSAMYHLAAPKSLLNSNPLETRRAPGSVMESMDHDQNEPTARPLNHIR